MIIMKNGWTYKKLGDVCDFEGGSQPPKNEWINHPQEGYVRMLQIRDFTKSRDAIIEYVKISNKIRLCNADDILIGRYGASVGKILTGLAGAYNVALIKSIPDETQIEKNYLRRYFESSLFQNVLFKVCEARAAQAGFSKNDISDSPIPIPPLSEQKVIVARFDAAFAHIDALKENAEKQLTEARKLFQAELTECMRPKDGWEIMKLGDFAYMKAGNFAKASEIKAEYEEGLFPCYGGNGFRGYIKEPNQEGDYCMIGRQGALCGCINRANGIFRTTEHAVIVKPYKAIPTSLVYYLLVNLNLNKYATGAAQPGLSVNHIADVVSISVPPESEWITIPSRLDTLSAKVRELEEFQKKTITECDALKQALLREIFE